VLTTAVVSGREEDGKSLLRRGRHGHGIMKERKKDYIHPALRAKETTMLSKPEKCHLDDHAQA
jgi:hypothetical protein